MTRVVPPLSKKDEGCPMTTFPSSLALPAALPIDSERFIMMLSLDNFLPEHSRRGIKARRFEAVSISFCIASLSAYSVDSLFFPLFTPLKCIRPCGSGVCDNTQVKLPVFGYSCGDWQLLLGVFLFRRDDLIFYDDAFLMSNNVSRCLLLSPLNPAQTGESSGIKRRVCMHRVIGRRCFCTGAPRPWLFVGLGNPGDKYRGTRHNVGFEMIDAFAESQGIPMSTVHCKAMFGQGFVGDVPVFLAKPQTYMNLSGESVKLSLEYLLS
ncbi:uncharacterized protein J3R85_010571 [Psidium guajava]|nr:uncharacterized protein J3R85_010571 [Psidium guajava]